jgi:hypothetical protein
MNNIEVCENNNVAIKKIDDSIKSINVAINSVKTAAELIIISDSSESEEEPEEKTVETEEEAEEKTVETEEKTVETEEESDEESEEESDEESEEESYEESEEESDEDSDEEERDDDSDYEPTYAESSSESEVSDDDYILESEGLKVDKKFKPKNKKRKIAAVLRYENEKWVSGRKDLTDYHYDPCRRNNGKRVLNFSKRYHDKSSQHYIP